MTIRLFSARFILIAFTLYINNSLAQITDSPKESGSVAKANLHAVFKDIFGTYATLDSMRLEFPN
ncbi:hypothetical protein SAMN05421747_11771 [Parapedobacter composti]|uniref:Uncharacterized protein n=1 Tax=Parapedobacter composti TaxID=623281 RepID=A0A1I1L4E1_9SPHI|nr:hypothetical protein SAMN05421747_11771 [Parapedobacter composti]